LMMEVPLDSNLRFQVMTHEGVHVLGHSIDTATQAALVSGDAAFSATNSYSSTYLNAVGTAAYLDTDMTYGFLAKSIDRLEYTPAPSGSGMQQTTLTVNAQIETAPVRLQDNATASTVDLIAANSLVLNDQALPPLTLAAGVTSSAADMATWLNASTGTTGVTATASTIIRAPATSIDLTQQVRIGGQLIGGGSYPSDIHALSTAINNETSTTNVTSYVDREGDLIITNAAGFEGANIALSNPDVSSATNALGQANQTYIGNLSLDSADKIRFTFGASGVPADLAVLGLRTGIYIDSSKDEDLAVFITGTGSANVAAGFTPPPVANKLANEQPFSIDFVSATQYTITDTTTGTVVATRAHVAGDDIDYQTLSLTFDTDPLAGDRFVVDGNKDGIGNNTNMLLLVALQDKPVLSNGRTIRDGYIDIVSTVGNKATLGKISQEALQVVYDQANASRDQVSGVSLDEEAADLIRYQQAYQASAQIIQMASKLFDSILGIR
jgi:flagellar hook-associated protein FlgK